MGKYTKKIIAEEIWSPIEDLNIKNELNNSPIWKNCLHSSDAKGKEGGYFYKIGFDGLIPVQVMDVKKL